MAAEKYSSAINQYVLERQLKLLFPNEQTYVDSKRQLKIKYPFSGKHLELDVWIPKKSIAFEFQDLYHYITTWYAQHTLEHIQQKDSMKKSSVQQIGITLVPVPCWWSGNQESLAATIHFERPDVISNHDFPPIPLNPPRGYFPKTEVPGVGELMLASFPRDLDFDPVEIDHSWWIGEKYDGVRCCWNPSVSQLYSRNGRKVTLHKSVKNHFPKIFLDGEIWFGKEMFALASNLFNSSVDFVSWHFLRTIFFDTPNKGFQDSTFETRYQHILFGVTNEHPFSVVATRVLCQDNTHLNACLEKVVESGGEGMIVRKVGSKYLHGRSSSLIKLKTTYADKEALVVGFDCDAVLLKMPNGETFSTPYEDVLIPTPSKGDIVTYSYELANLRKNANPKICKLRSDLNWDDVVVNYTRDRQRPEDILQSKADNSQDLHISPGAGTWNSVASRRKFFENYAKEFGFDPLVPTNWYSQQMETIMSFNGAARVIFYHQNSASTALLDLFPDIGLDKNKLWSERENTVMLHVKTRSIQIFEKFAKENGFDPLNPTAWFSQTKRKIMSNKSIARVVSLHYKGKVSKALNDLFPTSFTPFRPNRIPPSEPDHWSVEESRRIFFERYAEENGFDPYNPENWYSQEKDEILSTKGAMKVISYHGGKLSNALIDLFPDIGLDETKLSWHKLVKWRNLFENYAKQQGFDHLRPENWYQHREKILSTKGVANIIQNHQYSLSQTLVDLFPDIGLEKSKLRNGPIWPDRETRKRFFEKYASTHGFDPRDTDHWFSQSKSRIFSSKGGSMMDTYYKGNVQKALQDLFPDLFLDVSKFKSEKIAKEGKSM